MSLFNKIKKAVGSAIKAVGSAIKSVAKGFGNLFKDIGKALWRGVKFVVKIIVSMLSLVFCYTGVTPGVYASYVGLYQFRNRDKNKVKLTERMRLYMSSFFVEVGVSGLDLSKPTVIPNARLLWVGKDTEAVTLGHHIYVRKGWGGRPPLTLAECSITRMETLLHELVHVRQYEKYGWQFPCMYLFSWTQAGFSYDNMDMEREAKEFVARHGETLRARMIGACIPDLVPRLYD